MNCVPSSSENLRNHCLNKSSEMIYPTIYSTDNYVPFISTIPFGFNQFTYQTQFLENLQFSKFDAYQIPFLNQYQQNIQQYQKLQRKSRKKRIKSTH